jgi:transcription elongation factor Elf1
MIRTITRCLICGHQPVTAVQEGRIVTTMCEACGARLAIEFDPPDNPQVRARIERLDQADEA